jgi:hypothetical protein
VKETYPKVTESLTSEGQRVDAMANQGLDPAGSVALNGKRFIVGGGIPVVFAPFDHEEDGAQNLVCQSDNAAFVAAQNDERFELRLEDRLGTAGGMGSILTALQYGKPILVMPRLGRLKETRNDHQVATAQRFREMGKVAVAMDEGEIVAQLDGLPGCTWPHRTDFGPGLG